MKKILLLCAAMVAIGLIVSCSSENETPEWTVIVQSDNNLMGYTTGTGVYDNNTTVTIKAFPHEGFVFQEWNDGNNANPREIIVNSDKSYTAYFHAIGSDPTPIDTGQFVDFNPAWVLGLWMRNTNHEFWRFKTNGTGVTWDLNDEVTEEESDLVFSWEVSGHTLNLLFNGNGASVLKGFYLLSQTQDKMVLSDVYGLTNTFYRVP